VGVEDGEGVGNRTGLAVGRANKERQGNGSENRMRERGDTERKGYRYVGHAQHTQNYALRAHTCTYTCAHTHMFTCLPTRNSTPQTAWPGLAPCNRPIRERHTTTLTGAPRAQVRIGALGKSARMSAGHPRSASQHVTAFWESSA
jgi:hypothetical protein